MSSPELGAQLPTITSAPPGPESRRLAGELARYESPNVTYLADDFPVFWDEALSRRSADVDELRAHGVLENHIFGSVARGEEDPDSDVVLRVELVPGVGLSRGVDIGVRLA